MKTRVSRFATAAAATVCGLALLAPSAQALKIGDSAVEITSSHKTSTVKLELSKPQCGKTRESHLKVSETETKHQVNLRITTKFAYTNFFEGWNSYSPTFNAPEGLQCQVPDFHSHVEAGQEYTVTCTGQLSASQFTTLREGKSKFSYVYSNLGAYGREYHHLPLHYRLTESPEKSTPYTVQVNGKTIGSGFTKDIDLSYELQAGDKVSVLDGDKVLDSHTVSVDEVCPKEEPLKGEPDPTITATPDPGSGLDIKPGPDPEPTVEPDPEPKDEPDPDNKPKDKPDPEPKDEPDPDNKLEITPAPTPSEDSVPPAATDDNPTLDITDSPNAPQPPVAGVNTTPETEQPQQPVLPVSPEQPVVPSQPQAPESPALPLPPVAGVTATPNPVAPVAPQSLPPAKDELAKTGTNSPLLSGVAAALLMVGGWLTLRVRHRKNS